MKYLTLSLLLFFSLSTYCQADLLEKVKGKYFYKGNVYQQKELGSVYEILQESLDLYISGMKRRKSSNVFTYIGLPFTVGGILGLSSDGLDNIVFGGISFLIGGIIELVAIFPRLEGNHKLRKALRTFNYEMIERYGYQSDTSLSLGMTGNGLGFVYCF